MPSNNRGGSRRGGQNNNPEGRNQFSNSGWVDTAKERPMATAAAAAAAVGAGVFLWSRRNQISDQISNLSDKISDFAEDYRSGSSSGEMEMAGGPSQSSAMGSSGSIASGSSGSTSSRSASNGAGNRNTAKARRTSGRAEPQSTVM